MCIRDSTQPVAARNPSGAIVSADINARIVAGEQPDTCCLLYTSDAADERSSVDLGGRRIIKKKNTRIQARSLSTTQTQHIEQPGYRYKVATVDSQQSNNQLRRST